MSESGDDIGREGEDRALVAEYVLGLLDGNERALVAKRIASEPQLAAEARLWQARFSTLNDGFSETPVPPRLLAAIEARLFGSMPRTTGLSALWENLTFWRGLATAGLAVAVIAIGVNVMRPVPLDPRAFASQFVAALEAEGSNVKFLALYDAATGSVRLTALSGEPVPDRDFELWAIEGSNAPVSMGVIPANQRSEVTMTPDILAQFGAGSVLAITLEPKGGSPTGNPTGPIIAKGIATQI